MTMIMEWCLHLGGTSGFPLDAHHPTWWISGTQRLHQKSLLVSLSKPSYRSRALNPGKENRNSKSLSLQPHYCALFKEILTTVCSLWQQKKQQQYFQNVKNCFVTRIKILQVVRCVLTWQFDDPCYPVDFSREVSIGVEHLDHHSFS